MIKILKFGSTWCGPCKTIAPIFEQIKKDNPEVEIISIDIDDDVDKSNEYGIRNIPTVIFEKDGEIVEKLSGSMPLHKYQEVIEKYND